MACSPSKPPLTTNPTTVLPHASEHNTANSSSSLSAMCVQQPNSDKIQDGVEIEAPLSKFETCQYTNKTPPKLRGPLVLVRQGKTDYTLEAHLMVKGLDDEF